MSEGGLLAWKIQKVKKPANGIQSTCNFSDLNHPLPDPPKDQMWIQEGREWKLVPVVEAVPAASSDSEIEMAVASAGKFDEQGSDDVTAVAVSTAVPVTNCKSNLTNNKNIDIIEDGIMYHQVQETDTFQGLCLRYKVTPTELRRANKMMGTNLQLAPKKLIIPMNKNNLSLKNNIPKGMTKEEQIAKLVCEVRCRCKCNEKIQQHGLAYSEARAYLEMNDWDINSAVENAVDDLCWSSGRD